MVSRTGRRLVEHVSIVTVNIEAYQRISGTGLIVLWRGSRISTSPLQILDHAGTSGSKSLTSKAHLFAWDPCSLSKITGFLLLGDSVSLSSCYVVDRIKRSLSANDMVLHEIWWEDLPSICCITYQIAAPDTGQMSCQGFFYLPCAGCICAQVLEDLEISCRHVFVRGSISPQGHSTGLLPSIQLLSANQYRTSLMLDEARPTWSR